MVNTTLRSALVLVVAMLPGCSDDSSPRADFRRLLDGARPTDAAGPTLVSARLLDLNSGAIQGLSVCTFLDGKKTNNCTTTGANGRFELGVPTNTETGFCIEKTGYGAALLPFWTESSAPVDLGPGAMFTDAQTAAIFSQTGVTQNAATGMLVVNGALGVKFALSPSAGKGPFYADNQNVLSTTLGAMTAPYPWGVALDLPPGSHDVLATTASGQPCRRGLLGWPSKTAGAVKVPAIAGFISAVEVRCD